MSAGTAGGKEKAMTMQELAGQVDERMARGDWPGAEALLRQHRARAEAERNEERALALCSEPMGLYRQWGREKSFQDVLERTMVLLETVRPEPVSRGTILINAATGLAAFGGNRRALALFQEAWHCYRTRLEPGDRRLAALFNNMAAALQALGETEKAEEYMRWALAVLALGPLGPDTATTWVNLAQLQAGRPDGAGAAAECLERAMECLDDPELVWDGYYAHTARKCAWGLCALGRRDLARELEERAAILVEGT